MSDIDKIFEQVGKKRFRPRPIPWVNPQKEDLDSVRVMSPQEFSDRDAMTYSSSDAHAPKNVMGQVRKKKPKKKKSDRVVEKSIKMSARMRIRKPK